MNKIDLCDKCWCMTKTLKNGLCGKCKKKKLFKNLRIVSKIPIDTIITIKREDI